MFASKALPFVLSFVVAGVVGLDLDVNNQDSIKAAAKSLAAGIVAKYDADVKSSSVPGLFEKPYYFWETGTVMNALIGYSHLTGDKQYDAKVSEALVFQKGELDNFMPVNQTATIGNDDQSCWGLAAMTAAEVGLPKLKDAEWITYATNVWENQALRLELESGKNGTCGGGLRWQIFSFAAGYDFKDAWSNGNFFLLSARLAKFTGNSTYSQYADKSFQWAKDIGLISETYAVLAGAQATSGCKNINRIFTSATHGIYTEGAALMYNMTKAQNWTQAVNGFVNASSTFQENDVLVEVMCENNDKCDVDQRAYKGVFARTFARAAVAAPIVKDAITKILTASAKAAAKSCEGTGNSVKCPFEWGSAASKYANQSTPIEGNLGEAYNALEVIQGLLYPQAKALNTKGGTTAGVNPSQSGAPTGTGANPPQSTGAAGMVSVSFTAVLVGALFTVLGC